jgi:hypothetical protein
VDCDECWKREGVEIGAEVVEDFGCRDEVRMVAVAKDLTGIGIIIPCADVDRMGHLSFGWLNVGVDAVVEGIEGTGRCMDGSLAARSA